MNILRTIYLKQIISIAAFKFKQCQHHHLQRKMGKFLSVILANRWKWQQTKYGGINLILKNKIRKHFTYSA